MRGSIRRSLPILNPISLSNATRQSLFPFSTSSSSSGGDGRGRGRGLGSPAPFGFTATSAPGQPDTDPSEPVPVPGHGHGRGRGVVMPPPQTSDSFISASGSGRGRGQPFKQEPVRLSDTADSDAVTNLPQSLLSVLTGTGRGKPVKPPPPPEEPQSKEENRHVRARQGPSKAQSRRGVGDPQLKMTPEEAVQNAMNILSRGGEDDGGGVSSGGSGGGRGVGRFRGRGGRGRGRGRGRGDRGRTQDSDEGYGAGLYLGDNADGEKLAKKLGPEIMNQLAEGFEEMSSRVLPSPLDDAFVDAMDYNYAIECEPEYLMGDFDRNPDIDEKPPIPLRDAFEKMKPFLMAYEGIQSQEEWEEIMKETMERVPLMKEIVDYYSGPDRVTAKTQQEELERVANTLPESAPDSVKRFADCAVLSLQSNPGWGYDKKCQFMDKLVMKVSQQYK